MKRVAVAIEPSHFCRTANSPLARAASAHRGGRTLPTHAAHHARGTGTGVARRSAGVARASVATVTLARPSRVVTARRGHRQQQTQPHPQRPGHPHAGHEEAHRMNPRTG
jgi:hypothetical protein